MARTAQETGQRDHLNRSAHSATVRVIDADGDGDPDLVLMFNAGTTEDSQLVYRDKPAHAGGGNQPPDRHVMRGLNNIKRHRD